MLYLVHLQAVEVCLLILRQAFQLILQQAFLATPRQACLMLVTQVYFLQRLQHQPSLLPQEVLQQ